MKLWSLNSKKELAHADASGLSSTTRLPVSNLASVPPCEGVGAAWTTSPEHRPRHCHPTTMRFSILIRVPSRDDFRLSDSSRRRTPACRPHSCMEQSPCLARPHDDCSCSSTSQWEGTCFAETLPGHCARDQGISMGSPDPQTHAYARRERKRERRKTSGKAER